ncbi:LuxR C-terminal-related transcriptional regulator [Ahniella affigens]|nr:response regulator transcription factor [Ahniella affigens]
MLADDKAYYLAWTAPDLVTARIMVKQPFDLLLLNPKLPDGRGTSLLPLVRGLYPQALVLAFATADDTDTVLDAIESGVDGYVLQSSESIVVTHAMDRVRQGESPVSPSVVGHLCARLRRREPDDEIQLTRRQRDVLQAFARGATYRAAAESLQMTPNTLSHHVKNLYRRLGVRSRGEAVAVAMQRRLIKLSC